MIVLNSFIAVLVLGHKGIGKVSMLCITSFRYKSFVRQTSSNAWMLVVHIFLLGVFIILFKATLSLGFIIYFRYDKISLISFLSKNLNQPKIL